MDIPDCCTLRSFETKRHFLDLIFYRLCLTLILVNLTEIQYPVQSVWERTVTEMACS